MMKSNKAIVFYIILLSTLIFTCKTKSPIQKDSNGKIIVNPNPSSAYLSPKESLKSFHIPDGYELELVAHEPMISEPVAIVWDGNGVMYVAEMNNYMQDMKATNQNSPTCRIMRLEDTNWDGKMDKVSVFIDSLVLPRMMLCIGDELFINETFTYNIWAYKDTNGDGKADSKRQAYHSNKIDTRNMEHQNSGLIWNMDNYIYMARDVTRYRYKNKKFIADTLTVAHGQWGLTSDNYGKLFFSSAGGEKAAVGFQINPAYGPLEFNNHWEPNFQAVWPIIATPDVQGGMKRLRPDTTLNHFTASCGQSIYRGDLLPIDLQGDLLICEPVGRLIRRAKVDQIEGKTFLRNAYKEQEFISSTDMNFRPVNTATGPDGYLYIVDMNRGIIQEKQFINDFLGPRIKRLNLDKNIGNGRIYRLVHKNYKKSIKPNLLDDSSAKLVTYLDHPNGWWRENAQKELINREEKSVIPLLKEIILGSDISTINNQSHLAKIHALWTLEGLNAISEETLIRSLKDKNEQVRKTSIWISESYIKNNNQNIISELGSLKNDKSKDVLSQLVLSLDYSDSKEAKEISNYILNNHLDNEYLSALPKALEIKKNTKEYGNRLGSMNTVNRNIILNGASIHKELCSSCHGNDGKGISIGENTLSAPAFVGSKRIKGDKDNLIKILLHGLTGPVDGKDYETMAPFGAYNSDEWVSSILSYMRYEFVGVNGNAAIISPQEVKMIRESVKRDKPWTLKELENN